MTKKINSKTGCQRNRIGFPESHCIELLVKCFVNAWSCSSEKLLKSQ